MASDATSPAGPTREATAPRSPAETSDAPAGADEIEDAPEGRRGSLSRDLISAYAASGAKVPSWAFLSALVNRVGTSAVAVLALGRSTLGLLNYTSLGLAPGMIRLLTSREETPYPDGPADTTTDESDAEVIPYARPIETDSVGVHPSLRGYSNGVTVSVMTGAVGMLLSVAYAGWFPFLHRLPAGIASPIVLVMGMGLGTVLRLMSDAPGAVLQAEGEIATDNLFLALAEGLWVVSAGAATWMTLRHDANVLNLVGIGYAVSGCALLIMRVGRASTVVGQLLPDWRLVPPRSLQFLIGFGSMVTVAQLADFLYAPTDFILINRL